ncbi:MAG: CoA pyrophosphatase [Polyangiaceae bacterium]
MPPVPLDSVRQVLSTLEVDDGSTAIAGGGRYAAVAAVLRPAAGDTEVLLIRRAEHDGDPWSGHMAFPGGRHDPEDTSLLYTAERETQEEVGLDLRQSARLLGALPRIPAVARGKRLGLAIAPFVFELEGQAVLSPNHEVSEALWAPLGPLLSGERDIKHTYDWQGQRVYLPAYDVDGRTVWGLTYQMLQILFDRLRGAAR